MEFSNKKNAYYVISLLILSFVAFMSRPSEAMEIEYDKAGVLKEAEGDYALEEKFEPGAGKMSLKQAVAALQKAGKTPTGDWNYEESFFHGWTYEFEGRENGHKMEYLIDATSGKLIKEKVDD